MWRTCYTVRGRGVFPTDMLRYDQSFPVASEDVLGMEGDYSAAARDVRLGCYTQTKVMGEPTTARWNSFGWSVTDVSQEKV